MASWLRRFLLKTVYRTVFTLVLFSSASLHAEEEQTAPLKIQTEQLIQPEIERRTVELSNIDTEDFEVTGFVGVLSIEDFGANAVMGVRLAYHLNEDIFIEGSLAKSKAGQTSYERLSGGTPLLTAAQREVLYYNVSIGYNLLPGESFLTRNTSFNSTVYLIAGVGNTTFAGSDKLTINMGGGFRLLATDWLALHIDVRNHIFNIDILAEDKTANNLEVTFGLSAFF
ncbi:MAG: outer membrane beta-barrel domain-containing protein [Gammaproteobacteria bacterium]|nr:outer membrane beta-barrel domain-containing protein [Gammaproteobacteria bacterium]